MLLQRRHRVLRQRLPGLNKTRKTAQQPGVTRAVMLVIVHNFRADCDALTRSAAVSPSLVRSVAAAFGPGRSSNTNRRKNNVSLQLQ